MKLPNPAFHRPRGGARPGNALRGGGYALAVTAVVLAILVAVNVFAAALPASLTHQDISAAQFYSVTSNTKVVVNNLAEDVTIYWIVQSGEEDDVIQNLLEKYDSLSDHITVEKRNPDVYPTFAQQYTDQEVANNSLVVECGDQSRYIPLTDIYLGEINPYTGGYNATDFDGEGAITSAIDYVTSNEYPQVYLLEGHGEGELPSAFASQIEKENVPLAAAGGRHPGGRRLPPDLRAPERSCRRGKGDAHRLCRRRRQAAGLRRRGGGRHAGKSV